MINTKEIDIDIKIDGLSVEADNAVYGVSASFKISKNRSQVKGIKPQGKPWTP